MSSIVPIADTSTGSKVPKCFDHKKWIPDQWRRSVLNIHAYGEDSVDIARERPDRDLKIIVRIQMSFTDARQLPLSLQCSRL